jgi:hypothetical protein
MKSTPPKQGRPRSPVARHMNTFCKPARMRDKKKDYQRTPKHRQADFRGFPLAA